MKLEKIFYINLAKDQERRQLLEERLQRYMPNIPVERVAAIGREQLADHLPIIENQLASYLQAVAGQYPRPGTLGCFLSHYKTLQAINTHWQRFGDVDSVYLVLEDDCVFDGTVLSRTSKFVDRYLPADWHVAKHSIGWVSRADRYNRAFYDLSKARDKHWQYYLGAHFTLYRGCHVASIIERVDTSEIRCYDRWLRDFVNGVYSFSQFLHIKQSNLGGSNTNDELAYNWHEDRTLGFRRNWIGRRLINRLRLELPSW